MGASASADYTKCIDDFETAGLSVQKGINELKSSNCNAKDIIDGLFDVAVGLKGIPDAMKVCKASEEQIMEIEESL